jgi:hypothetical protein
MDSHKRKIDSLESSITSSEKALKKALSSEEEMMLKQAQASIRPKKIEHHQARMEYHYFLRNTKPIDASGFNNTKSTLEAELFEAYEALRTAEIAVEEFKQSG